MPSEFNRIHYEEVTSTNDVCKEEHKKSSKITVITADKQTQGRGRSNKAWASPKGNVSFSFGFTSSGLIDGLSVKAGLTVAKTISKSLRRPVQLKWPNDLIFESKKVGGILVEAENVEEKFILVIGIGINFSIVPKEGHWGDLNIDNYELKEKFISELIKNLLKDIVDDPSPDWHREWNEYCVHLNQEVELENNEAYVFKGVNNLGRMIGEKSSQTYEISESSLKVKGLY